MRRTFSILGLAALLAGCATGGRPAGGGWDASVERGQRLAERACAGCHAIDAQGESPRAGAPNFGAIRMRYTSPQLERRFEAISSQGHYEMPPIYILPDEGKDLAAYIESLGGR